MAEPIPFQKIVVPLDGSKWAEKAIPHAEQIARGGGELMLVHVYRPAGSEFLADSTLGGQTAHLSEARQRAEQYVKGLRGRISSPNIRVSAHVCEGSDVAHSICRFVRDEEADVVVMPSASHHKLARVLMGDLTTSVTGCVNACLLLVRGNLEAEWDEESKKVLAGRGQDAIPDPNVVPETLTPDNDTLLQQLTTLRDAGILTDAEFEVKKAAVENRQNV